MFLDHQPKPRLALMEPHPPEFVIASKAKRTLEKVTFEYISQHRPEVVTAALVWNTNSYLVDVEEQVFVVNGGKKIRFDEWPIDNRRLLLIQSNRQDVKEGELQVVKVVSYMLGIEGTHEGQPRMIFVHISPDGSQFEFKTAR